MKYQYQILVITLANNLVGQGFPRAIAMQMAHATIKKHGENAFILKYYNESKGREVTRVAKLYSDRFDEPQPASRPHLLIYDDLMYIALEEQCTRSAKRTNINYPENMAFAA